MTDVFFVERPWSTTWYKLSLSIPVVHREDGPAIEWKSGHKAWCMHGEEYEFETWCKMLNKSPKEIMLLKLKYS